MKIAVFSDVHGNLPALEAVLARIRAENPDLTVFLGDIFQRGNREFECLDLLRSSGVVCVKGNCELYAQYGVDVDPDVEHLREYYDAVREKLTEEQMAFLRRTPLFYEAECGGRRLRFSHFLFKDIRAPYPFLQLADMKNGVFDRVCRSESVRRYDLVLVGHSHRNFENGNVISVSAAGLEGASWLLIEADETDLRWKRFSLEPSGSETDI